MAKVLLFGVVFFIILDFSYYMYLKNIKKEEYKNYIDYIKKSIK